MPIITFAPTVFFVKYSVRKFNPDGGLVGGLGLVTWFVVVLLEGPRLGVISSLLALGPLVVVPLGFAAIRPNDTWVCIGIPAAVFAIVLRSGSSEVNRMAVAMASVWLAIVASVFLPAGYVWATRTGGKRFVLDVFLPLAALAELTVAATWLLASTLQIELLGFSATIVLLTSVHFHFAGFGACVVAVTRMRGATTEKEQTWSGRAALLVLFASPVVAIGHLTVGAFELLGGVLLTAGVWIVSFLGWRECRRSTGVVRALLMFGALSPLVSMLFALHYGLTKVTGLQQIPYAKIALIHGGLNAFGFIIANLIAADVKASRNR